MSGVAHTRCARELPRHAAAAHAPPMLCAGVGPDAFAGAGEGVPPPKALNSSIICDGVCNNLRGTTCHSAQARTEGQAQTVRANGAAARVVVRVVTPQSVAANTRRPRVCAQQGGRAACVRTCCGAASASASASHSGAAPRRRRMAPAAGAPLASTRQTRDGRGRGAPLVAAAHEAQVTKGWHTGTCSPLPSALRTSTCLGDVAARQLCDAARRLAFVPRRWRAFRHGAVVSRAPLAARARAPPCWRSTSSRSVTLTTKQP